MESQGPGVAAFAGVSCGAAEAAISADEPSSVEPLSMASDQPPLSPKARFKRERRVRSECAFSCAPTTSAAESTAAIADAAAGALEPEAAAVAVPADEFTQRLKLMLKLDVAGPAASGREGVTPVVAKEHVLFAWTAVNDLCDAHGTALSQAYGNFDRVVALGWLLGDVALGFLVEHTDAYKIGLKARKLAPGLKAEFDAPHRRLGKRKHVSEEEWAGAAEEESKLRMAPVKLPLPTAPAPVPAPAPAPAADASPPGRKCRVSRIRADPTDTPEEAAAREWHNRRHDLLSALRAAEAALTQADAAAAGAKRDREHAKKAYEDKMAWLHNPHRMSQISDEKWEVATKERDALAERWHATARAHNKAEGALDEAKFAASEAREDVRLYEEERMRREVQERRERQERADHEERIRQIDLGLFLMNSRYAPDDPQRWEPDEWEYSELYHSWKLDWEP